jgi:hypothetical protein
VTNSLGLPVESVLEPITMDLERDAGYIVFVPSVHAPAPPVLSEAQAHPPPDVYFNTSLSLHEVIRERPFPSTCRPVATAPALPRARAIESAATDIPLPAPTARVMVPELSELVSPLPPDIVLVPPRDVEEEPVSPANVMDELVRDELPILLKVLLAPDIVAPVKVPELKDAVPSVNVPPVMVPSTERLAVPAAELVIDKVRSLALLKSKVNDAPVKGTDVSDMESAVTLPLLSTAKALELTSSPPFRDTAVEVVAPLPVTDDRVSASVAVTVTVEPEYAVDAIPDPAIVNVEPSDMAPLPVSPANVMLEFCRDELGTLVTLRVPVVTPRPVPVKSDMLSPLTDIDWEDGIVRLPF